MLAIGVPVVGAGAAVVGGTVVVGGAVLAGGGVPAPHAGIASCARADAFCDGD